MITPLQAIQPLIDRVITVKQKIPIEALANADPKLGWPSLAQLRGLNRSPAQILADLHAQLRRQESICEDAAQVYADARYCKEQIIAQIRELERDGNQIGAA
jgi:hypothetical protein